ncbi:MAG: hypothetical protein QOJ03_2567 [Frankiaceae bacterium]|jgi:hypothetical protein|nr:hypothetical protein [Frankiaceae bacterium]
MRPSEIRARRPRSAQPLPGRPPWGRLSALGAAASTAAAVLWTCRPAAAPVVSTDPARCLVVIAAWVAWALVAYLGGCTVVASVAACCHPDARIRAWAAQCSPVLVRRMLALALGSGLSVGGVTPSAYADAGPVAPHPATAQPSAPESLDWPGIGARPRLVATRASDPVVVHRGDSLWAIAERALCRRSLPCAVTDEAVAAAWPDWWATNRHVIGSDPDLIRPGQRLASPAPEQRSGR